MIERYLPSPSILSGHRIEEEGSLAGEQSAPTLFAPRAQTQGLVTADLREVLITACRDTQTSADAFIDGTFNGALTYAIVDMMRRRKGRLTYRELHEGVVEVLKNRKFEQVPQLEGRAANFDAPLLSEQA